jgi:hypothetical protein
MKQRSGPQAHQAVTVKKTLRILLETTAMTNHDRRTTATNAPKNRRAMKMARWCASIKNAGVHLSTEDANGGE